MPVIHADPKVRRHRQDLLSAHRATIEWKKPERVAPNRKQQAKLNRRLAGYEKLKSGKHASGYTQPGSNNPHKQG